MKLRLQVDEAVRGFPDTCPWPKLGCVGLRAPGSLSDPIFPTPGWLPLAVFQMYFWSQFVCVPCQNLCHSLSLSLFADGGWTTCSTSTRRFTEIPLGKSSIVIDGHNLDDSVIFDFQVWFHWHRVRTHSLSYSGLPLRYLDSLSLSDSSSFCLFLQKKKRGESRRPPHGVESRRTAQAPLFSANQRYLTWLSVTVYSRWGAWPLWSGVLILVTVTDPVPELGARVSTCFPWRNTRREAMTPPARFQGVDEEVLKLLEANMDHAPARRRAREAFKDIQLSIDHILFKVQTYYRLSVSRSCFGFLAFIDRIVLIDGDGSSSFRFQLLNFIDTVGLEPPN